METDSMSLKKSKCIASGVLVNRKLQDDTSKNAMHYSGMMRLLVHQRNQLIQLRPIAAEFDQRPLIREKNGKLIPTACGPTVSAEAWNLGQHAILHALLLKTMSHWGNRIARHSCCSSSMPCQCTSVNQVWTRIGIAKVAQQAQHAKSEICKIFGEMSCSSVLTSKHVIATSVHKFSAKWCSHCFCCPAIHPCQCPNTHVNVLAWNLLRQVWWSPLLPSKPIMPVPTHDLHPPYVG